MADEIVAAFTLLVSTRPSLEAEATLAATSLEAVLEATEPQVGVFVADPASTVYTDDQTATLEALELEASNDSDSLVAVRSC